MFPIGSNEPSFVELVDYRDKRKSNSTPGSKNYDERVNCEECGKEFR